MRGSREKSVDIWRVIWAMLIVLGHAQLLPWNYEGNGYFRCLPFGVEFFFILTGYLLANSVHKLPKDSCTNVGEETWIFLFKKIKGIYPYCIFALFFKIVIYVVLGTKTTIKLSNIYQWIWSLFFLQTSGLGASIQSVIEATWYISAMLLAIAVIYPLLRKNTEYYLYVFAPLTAIFICGWFAVSYGKINFALVFKNGICLGLLRAIAEINLGCVCFLINSKISKIIKNSKPYSITWTVIEIFTMLTVIVISFNVQNSEIDFLCILLLSIGIISSFCGHSYTKKWLERFNVEWAHKFSLSLYLNHFVWVRALQNLSIPISLRSEIIIYLFLTILTSALCVISVDIVKLALNMRKSRKLKAPN